MIKCTRCGNEIKEGTKFCSKCGNNILEQQEKNKDEIHNDEKQFVKRCSNCGNELGEGTIFCPKCCIIHNLFSFYSHFSLFMPLLLCILLPRFLHHEFHSYPPIVPF